jgi:hypothetical protein
MSALRMRMQPWETCPGSSRGSFVPWMPTTPSPGQSGIALAGSIDAPGAGRAAGVVPSGHAGACGERVSRPSLRNAER